MTEEMTKGAIVHNHDLKDEYFNVIRKETDSNGRVWFCNGEFMITPVESDEEEEELLNIMN